MDPSFTSSFLMCGILADKLVQALNEDLLPDTGTEQALAMGGPMGQNLYGAIQTLQLRGRFSRTMIEHALVYSPTSYPEYIQLWMNSLPPTERSAYTNTLSKNKFKDIQWDKQLYENMHKRHIRELNDREAIEPPVPLGDNRHTPRMAKVAKYASFFHTLINYGYIFDTVGDFHAPLKSEYSGMMELDILKEAGELFGVKKSDCSWDRKRSDCDLDAVSNSEIILRSWNYLYFVKRLSITELEHALVQGPGAMRQLLKVGANLTVASPKFLDPKLMDGLDILEKLLEIDLDSVQFSTLTVSDGDSERNECDYCNEELTKISRCSGCKIALYCSRDCQRSDWIRHKPLCERYKAEGWSF